MADPVQVVWTPPGVTMDPLGSKTLVGVTDGDTPNIRMPVRMLSVNTAEVTARSDQRAAVIDAEFAQLAEWMEQVKAPISPGLVEYLRPRLVTGSAGTLHYSQGKQASAFAIRTTATRLSRADGSTRSLFVRIADDPFDDNGRLLAYVAPNCTSSELATLTRDGVLAHQPLHAFAPDPNVVSQP